MNLKKTLEKFEPEISQAEFIKIKFFLQPSQLPQEQYDKDLWSSEITPTSKKNSCYIYIKYW